MNEDKNVKRVKLNKSPMGGDFITFLPKYRCSFKNKTNRRSSKVNGKCYCMK